MDDERNKETDSQMNIVYFSINRDYEIKCKLFSPKNQDIKNVIIGVHGFAGDKESSVLEQLAFACSENGTALIGFDFPAHGESPVQEDMLTIENCKNDLLDVLSHVKSLYPYASISIFATSFGGYITLLCADKLEDFPLVLRAPAVSMPKILLENVLKISAGKFRKAGFVVCGFERKIPLPYSFYEDLLQQENILKKEIHQRSLILHGDRDNIVPLSDILGFCKMQKNTKLEIIHSADHRFKNTGEIEKIIRYTKNFIYIQFLGEDDN